MQRPTRASFPSSPPPPLFSLNSCYTKYNAPQTICINAPEGCQRGTHTNETAYPLGTYASVHTQTHSSARQGTMRAHAVTITATGTQLTTVSKKDEMPRTKPRHPIPNTHHPTQSPYPAPNTQYPQCNAAAHCRVSRASWPPRNPSRDAGTMPPQGDTHKLLRRVSERCKKESS